MSYPDPTEVRNLVVAHQTGDPTARDRLYDIFAGLINRVGRDADESQAAALEFFELIETIIPTENIARDLYFACLNGARQHRLDSTALIRVPTNTRMVIMRYVRRFDGDLHAAGEAAQAAGGHGLSYTSFMAGIKALRTIGVLEPYHATAEDSEEERVLNQMLVHDHILPNLKSPGKDIILLYYGFYHALRFSPEAAELGISPDDTLTDATVGLLMNMSPHQSRMWRLTTLANIRKLLEEPTE